MASITCSVSGTIAVNFRGVVSGPVASASGGTAPYTYKWFRGTSASFSPDTTNFTNQINNCSDNPAALTDIVPNGVTFYYKCVATDNVGDTAGTSSATSGIINNNVDGTFHTFDVSGAGSITPNAGASQYFVPDSTH